MTTLQTVVGLVEEYVHRFKSHPNRVYLGEKEMASLTNSQAEELVKTLEIIPVDLDNHIYVTEVVV